MHQSLLRYQNFRYGWWALVLLLISVGLFISQSDFQPPNGGTLQGYVLGTIGALLIVWLTALGIVKRRYGRSNLQAWTSAHVYLGLALLVVASLHSAMQFGWNVHTLAYVLMCIVIASGGIGLTFYLRYPRMMVLARDGRSRQQLFEELNELNRTGQALASRCQVDVRTASETAIARTGIGGGLLDQLLGRDTSTVVLPASATAKKTTSKVKAVTNRDQQYIIDYVAACIPRARKQGEAETLQKLLEVLCRRQVLTRQLRDDIKFHARLKVWLWAHVPCTVATLVALIIHVFSVFFFW
jgi:hypothetical protein